MQTAILIYLIILGVGLVALIVAFVLALIHSNDKDEGPGKQPETDK